MRKILELVLVLLACVTSAVAQHTAPTATSTDRQQATPELRRLNELGYWCDTATSVTSAVNRQAVIAFQKVERLQRTGKIDAATRGALLRASRPLATDAISQRHYEVDLNRQILMLVDSSNIVTRVLCVSTGSGKWFETEKNGGRFALTPRGKFKVFYKVSGWRKSELGELYYPMYVRGGVAIHGAPSVPTAPASHGCIRIPMFAAQQLYRITPVGTPVIVYGENPKPTKG